MFESYQNLSYDDVMRVFTEVLTEHSIEFIANPVDFSSIPLDESSNLQFLDEGNGVEYDLVPADDYFNPVNSAGQVAILFEVEQTIKDLQIAPYDSNDQPIMSNNDGLFLNKNSKIPLSVYLLAFDRTIEKLKEMAVEHNFYDGKSISPAWLNRSLSLLTGQRSEIRPNPSASMFAG